MVCDYVSFLYSLPSQKLKFCELSEYLYQFLSTWQGLESLLTSILNGRHFSNFGTSPDSVKLIEQIRGKQSQRQVLTSSLNAWTIFSINANNQVFDLLNSNHANNKRQANNTANEISQKIFRLSAARAPIFESAYVKRYNTFEI